MSLSEGFCCPKCETAAFNWHYTHVECQDCGTRWRMEEKTPGVKELQYNNCDKKGWLWYSEKEEEDE